MLGGILMLVLNIVGGLLVSLLVLRGLLRWLRISFINPLGQFLLAATDWAVRPFQKVLPQIGRVDLACWGPAWLIQIALILIGTQVCYSPAGLTPVWALVILLQAGIDLLVQFIYLVMGVVFLACVLSWVNPYAPIAAIVNTLSAPFLRVFSRHLPRMGGIDLSPFVLLILLQIVLYIIARQQFHPYFCG